MKIPAWILAIALFAIAGLMIFSLITGKQFYINGEVWGISGRTLLKTYFSETISGSTRQTKPLGKHQFCALSQSFTHHHTQACGCAVERTTSEQDSEWLLKLNLDERASGNCSCRAVCID